MSYKIYHNTRCKHSRAGLDYLKSLTSDFEIREYITDSITQAQMKEILMKLNLKPSQIVRTNEEYYKTYLKGKSFNDEEWIRILLENPRLIQRPIIVGRYKAVVGNPPEEIDKLFKK